MTSSPALVAIIRRLAPALRLESIGGGTGLTPRGPITR